MFIRSLIVFLSIGTAITADEIKSFTDNIKYEFIQEVKNANQDPAKVYKLTVCSSETEIPVSLICKRMDGTFNRFSGLYIKKNGDLSRAANKDFVLAMTGGYGECFDIIIIKSDMAENLAKNSEPLGSCTITPFPLQIEDLQKHKIEAIPLDGSGKCFKVIVSGFEPNEKIQFKSRSCDEVISSNITVDENGSFLTIMLPGVIGKEEGPLEISVGNKQMKTLTLKHVWGKIAFSSPSVLKKLKNKYHLK